MRNIEDSYNELVEQWRTQTKGNGSINFGPKVSPLPVVLGVLYKVYNKNPTSKIIIITKNNEDRLKVINYLTHTDIPANNAKFEELIHYKAIRIMSFDVLRTWSINDYFTLSICVDINNYDITLAMLWSKSKFRLMCLTANTVTTGNIYKSCPLVMSNAVEDIVEAISITPVEETQIGVVIDRAEDIALLKQYDDYIAESVTIFGDFESIGMAIHGEPKLNISAVEYCSTVAARNGWNENLDMSYDYNKAIDAHFNPSTLCERARNTYDIRAKRSKLLSDNQSKLTKILEICRENAGKKILIINKTSDFAKTVTDYLNANLNHFDNGKRIYDACYNYHEDVDPIYDIDDNGERVKVKSGIAKGTYKMLKGKAQKSRAVDYFNRNLTYILSANNAPDKAISAQIDLLILTSSLCETIESYIQRLECLTYSDNIVKSVKLFCVNTLEERYLSKEKPSPTHTIVNNCEKDILIDNLSGNILVV